MNSQIQNECIFNSVAQVHNACTLFHKLFSKYLKYNCTFVLNGREFLLLFWKNYIDCRCLKTKCWVRYPDLRNRKQEEAERATEWKISFLLYCIKIFGVLYRNVWCIVSKCLVYCIKMFTWAGLKAPKCTKTLLVNLMTVSHVAKLDVNSRLILK